jgi:hypothetical protein
MSQHRLQQAVEEKQQVLVMSQGLCLGQQMSRAEGKQTLPCSRAAVIAVKHRYWLISVPHCITYSLQVCRVDKLQAMVLV